MDKQSQSCSTRQNIPWRFERHRKCAVSNSKINAKQKFGHNPKAHLAITFLLSISQDTESIKV